MTGAMSASRNCAMAAASERFFWLLSIKMFSFSFFFYYARVPSGRPYPWRVAVKKQFMGRTPAGSKAPGSYGIGGKIWRNGGQRMRQNQNRRAMWAGISGMKGRRFPGRRAGPAILLSASGTGAASGGVVKVWWKNVHRASPQWKSAGNTRPGHGG